MAKSKNHTNANQACKNHKNGIKRAPALHLYMKTRGMWQPASANARIVRKNNKKVHIKSRKDKLKKVRATFTK